MCSHAELQRVKVNLEAGAILGKVQKLDDIEFTEKKMPINCMNEIVVKHCDMLDRIWVEVNE